MSPRTRPHDDVAWAGGRSEADLAGLLDPPPPAPKVAPRVLRILARAALWTLVAAGPLGSLRGMPSGREPPAASPPTVADGQASAVAAAFLREYLTAGDGTARWRARLRPFMAADADLGKAPQPRSGASRYADLVLPAGTRSAGGSLVVTVLAHVVDVRGGRVRAGKLLAYAVTVTTTTGVAVAGPPRPTPLPLDVAPKEAGHSLPGRPHSAVMAVAAPLEPARGQERRSAGLAGGGWQGGG